MEGSHGWLDHQHLLGKKTRDSVPTQTVYSTMSPAGPMAAGELQALPGQGCDCYIWEPGCS